MRFVIAAVSLCLVLACQHSKKNNSISTSKVLEPSYLYKFFEPTNQKNYIDGKYPLIIFLHGAGERGDDLEQLDLHGPPKLVKADIAFPFGVLSPLCPKETWWNAQEVLHLLEVVIRQNPKIDVDRIYLTGLSMGGYGSWDLAYLAPDKFAAIAPICGGSLEHVFRVKEIKDIPFWVFHGAQDKVVPVENSRKLVAALKDIGSKLRYTEYPNADHDSWTKTYENKDLYDWFLLHSK